MGPVPTTSAVVRGANVNIVLKADQPTGRTVCGQVQDVLTRGNHPRGIKVRLADGRVGRVQSIAGPGQAALSTGAKQPEALGDEFSIGQGPGNRAWEPQDGGGRGGRGGGGRRQRGQREDEPEAPPQAIGLDAYIRPAKTKQGKGGRGGGATDELADGQLAAAAPSAETVSCPVCGAFEGDAAAVEHHVAVHFDA